MKKIIPVILGVVLGIQNTVSASEFEMSKDEKSKFQCSQIVSLLRDMKTAQTAVQESLIRNHEMVADSLDSYSEALRESQGRAHKTVVSSMQSASDSLRKRGDKGQELADKLADQTDLLIKKVSDCLK